jgi:hypothetical protein
MENNKIFLGLVVIVIVSIILGFVLGTNDNTEISNCQNEELLSPETEHRICQYIDLRDLSINNKKIEIGKVIKEKINNEFNVYDYIISPAESENNEDKIKVYDFIFVIKGAKTDIGYTVFVNENDTMIKSIFDNMQGYKVSELKEKYEDTIQTKIDRLSKLKIMEMRRKVLDITTKTKYIINIIGEEKRYDLTTNKLYYVILYEGIEELEDGTGFTPPKWVDIYKEEI